MRLRDLRTPLWLLGLLGVLEVGLELRAHRRGWETLLFGASAMHVEQGEARYGPREGYPFWGPVVSKARTPGVPRIWVASTSHAAPMDQPKDRIFPTRMRARCEALGRPCEVLNASEPGLVIEENIRALEALAPAWRPDVAVLYSMSNDITALSSRYLGGGGGLEAAEAEGEAATAPPPLPSWPERIGEQTTTWILLKTNLTARLVPSRVLSDELPPRAEAELLASVERFVRVARELGVKPVLCTFALSHRMSQRSELPDTWAYFAYSFNMHLSMRGWIRTVERLNGGLAEIAARLDVPLIDLDAQLGGHPELYSDLHHFKWEGHERVAELATQALLTIADGGS